MIRMCRDPKCTSWENYGGRGIDVLQEWVDDFWAFLEHVGPRPSLQHTLGRIDNEKGYFPGNVRWETWEQQGNNRRNSANITWDDRTQTIAQWSRELGLSEAVMYRRFKLGMSPEAILCLDAVPRRRSTNRNYERMDRATPLAPRPLTERQTEVLAFVVGFIDSRGYAPTLREIGKAVNVTSTNGVSDHLRALERKGFIVRDDVVARSIRVIKDIPGSGK